MTYSFNSSLQAGKRSLLSIYCRLCGLLLVAILFSTSIAMAKNVPLVSIDAAFFRYDDAQNYCEVFYSFPDSALTYRPDPNGGFIGEVYMRVEVGTKAKQEIAFHWIVEHKAVVENPPYETDLNGIKSFLLAPGTYSATIVIKDLAFPDDSALVRVPMQVPKFENDRVQLSTPILASEIEKIAPGDTERQNSVFRHSSLYVVPAASQVVTGTEPVLKTYLELYNAKRYLEDGFTARYRIMALNGEEKLRQESQQQASGNAQVLAQTVLVDTLPSGMYYVNIGIIDDEGQLQAETAKRFYLINPEQPPEQENLMSVDERYETSEFATMNAREIQKTWEQFRVLASPDELAVWDELTEDRARARFLFHQWDLRDPDYQTKVNEAYEDFKERVKYANTYFQSLRFDEGWRSSRGRVLLEYGMPDDVRRHWQEPETRPYEIWTFTQIQGGITFVFVDMANSGAFTLVHSTALEEQMDEKWFDRYARIVPGGNTNQDDILQGR